MKIHWWATTMHPRSTMITRNNYTAKQGHPTCQLTITRKTYLYFCWLPIYDLRKPQAYLVILMSSYQAGSMSDIRKLEEKHHKPIIAIIVILLIYVIYQNQVTIKTEMV